MNSKEAIKILETIKNNIENTMKQGGSGVAIGYDTLVDKTEAIDIAIRALNKTGTQ